MIKFMIDFDWRHLFSGFGSMTINGWEMMIPLAFFAATGYLSFFLFGLF